LLGAINEWVSNALMMFQELFCLPDLWEAFVHSKIVILVSRKKILALSKNLLKASKKNFVRIVSRFFL
jgi:hypothetical protein